MPEESDLQKVIKERNEETYAEFLDRSLPPGWSHDAETYGMDCSFICPDGHMIEPDGTCPDGLQSPLFDLGLI